MSDLTPDSFPDGHLPSGDSIPAPMSWQQQDGVLRDLWMAGKTPQEISDELGRSVPAIMTRAARLGLPRRAAPGRKPGVRRHDHPPRFGNPQNGPSTVRGSAVAQNTNTTLPQTSLRVCLMCLTKFESLGRHNRICGPCKGSAEYETATSLPELHITVS